MQWLDRSFVSPAENLACDEALLNWCEEGNAGEISRFWESPTYFVALGYTNKVREEVDADFCAAHGIPLLRRCSGGGTVLQGPGCFNYSLILRIPGDNPLTGITETNTLVMHRQRDALQPLLRGTVAMQGHTDLTLDNRKFSGNAQRRKRRFLLFHGTLLLNFNLPLIAQALRMPPKQPDYRHARSHLDFVTNLMLHREQVKTALKSAWSVASELTEIPQDSIEQLAAEKYSRDEWNLKF